MTALLCTQVHGHDFSCLACIPACKARGFTYASGSEEKVIRILEAPQAFLATLAEATGLEIRNGGQVGEVMLFFSEPFSQWVFPASLLDRQVRHVWP